jgi:hypothetical protein
MAKYFTVGGERKIIMSTLREIAMGEELTYDYKFARELDPNVPRIPCRCGSGESTTPPAPRLPAPYTMLHGTITPLAMAIMSCD